MTRLLGAPARIYWERRLLAGKRSGPPSPLAAMRSPATVCRLDSQRTDAGAPSRYGPPFFVTVCRLAAQREPALPVYDEDEEI